MRSTRHRLLAHSAREDPWDTKALELSLDVIALLDTGSSIETGHKSTTAISAVSRTSRRNILERNRKSHIIN